MPRHSDLLELSAAFRVKLLESEANTYAVDGIINYETVKYFNNEDYELSRYDATLKDWEHAAVKSQNSMSLLNFGQGAVIAVGVTFMMIFAAQGVVSGSMSLGDLVLVNTMMLQLFLPLNFLGVIYRALKYSLADMDMMMRLLDTREEIVDAISRQGGHLCVDDVATQFLDDDPLLGERRPHRIGIGGLEVHLVDGDDHRDAGRFGMIDGLDRLGHHTVVGRDHDDGDVRDVCASRP